MQVLTRTSKAPYFLSLSNSNNKGGNKKKSNNQNWRKKPGAGMPAYGFIYKVSLFPRNLYFRLQDVYEHKPVQKHMVVACVVSRGDNVCKGSREWARCVRPLWSMRLATLAFR